jgi:hypothetical protein
LSAGLGVQDKWLGSTEGVRDYTTRPVQQPLDWFKLKPLDPRQGWLGKTLECLRLIKHALGNEVPIIQTIFSLYLKQKTWPAANN